MNETAKSEASAPTIVATGFTTAFLGDERTLREFILGDAMREKMAERHGNAALYFINDTYDPLTEGQLRIGLSHDEKLIQKFRPFCGQPIAEVPDPFDCHGSYAAHFQDAWMRRLRSLDIHPVVIDSYRSYRSGRYAGAVAAVFARYSEIREMLAQRFPDFTIRTLFRPQCPRCHCLDATHVREVSGEDVRFECGRCGTASLGEVGSLKGKLAWKCDCAARWSLYRIDMETFSKRHLTERGTTGVARFLAESVFGGRIPAVVRYGEVRMAHELSGRLSEMLPPPILKKLFLANQVRELHLSPDSVHAFCRKYPVRPGISYLDWVRRELPHCVLRYAGWGGPGEDPAPSAGEIPERTLVRCGNAFSEFYFQRSYGLRAPDAKTLESADLVTVDGARRLLSYALSVREGSPAETRHARSLIHSHLHALGSSPQLYHFLRRFLGQAQGPSIPTLLTELPLDYLETVQLLCSYFVTASAHRAASLQAIPMPELWNVHEQDQEDAAQADGTYGPRPSGRQTAGFGRNRPC